MATVPPRTNTATSSPKMKTHPRDALRELVETIVFVVALVLMLKLFVVEAFVIPTGSMAETLYGYQKIVTCPQCDYEFPVNSSNEVDPWDGVRKPITGGCCPNCRLRWSWKSEASPRNESGDRVLVHKGVYSVGEPQRGHVVVFKFPVDPQVGHTAQNYIKRLWGIGGDKGETLGIYRGDLYLAPDLNYPEGELDSFGQPKFPRPKPEELERLWEGYDVDRHSKTRPPYRSLGLDFTYHNADSALKAFESSRSAGFRGGAGQFELIRKPDDLAISMRRIVYHNDHQSSYLVKKGVPPRWSHDGSWKSDSASSPKVFTHSSENFSWVRYSHRVTGPLTELPGRGGAADDPAEIFAHGRPLVDDWSKLEEGYQPHLFPPSLITNFLGYNAGMENGVEARTTGDHWVADLMLECTAKISNPADELVLELSKGIHRFQARFAGGFVTIVRLGPGGDELTKKPTPITSPGTYKLRFANFDCRLRVWVNEKSLDFGGAADYSPSDGFGYESAIGALTGGAFSPAIPFVNDDEQRRRIGLGPVGPAGYTLMNDILAPASIGAKGNIEVANIAIWQDTFFTPAANKSYANEIDPIDTFYVQPHHYLCLGDNSGQSSDSRKWGLVPERLMLGRAVFVFFPFSRLGFIR